MSTVQSAVRPLRALGVVVSIRMLLSQHLREDIKRVQVSKPLDAGNVFNLRQGTDAGCKSGTKHGQEPRRGLRDKDSFGFF